MAFATTDDVATRLEESSLSAEAEAAAEGLLDTATAVICAAVDKDDETWYSPLSTTKKNLVKGMTIELVCRAMASPQGLASASETLGAYTRSETYRRDLSSALFLTDAEKLVLRRMIFGRTTDSVVIGSHFQEVET